MGLYISKCLMRLMGGELNFRSDGYGQGSLFWITFRAEVVPWISEQQPPHHYDIKRPCCYVAIVDTSREFIRLTTSIIEQRQPMRYIVSGYTSIAELQNFLSTTRSSSLPIVILLDFKLFTDDCHILTTTTPTTKLFLTGRSSSPAMILPATARQFPFIRKPLRRSQLFSLLEECFASPTVDSSGVVTVLNSCNGTLAVNRFSALLLRVLVAEDNITNQLIIKKLLTSLGINNVTVANDGIQAVTAVESGSFDVVLMDVMVLAKV